VDLPQPIAHHPVTADNGFVRVRRNPYQRGAAGCLLIAGVVGIAGAQAASLIAGGIAVVLALIAYIRRRDYPR
jgi:hypothetical protein